MGKRSTMITQLKMFFGFEETEEPQEAPSPIISATVKKPPKEPLIGNFKGRIIEGKQKVGLSEIKIEEPSVYEDSITIASYLREHKPVIINLKHLDKKTGKRLIDFICGTAYAINGNMLKIAESIFIFTPESVLISDSAVQSTLDKGFQEEQSQLFLKDSVG
jgi:cell division inhibitor SepF